MLLNQLKKPFAVLCILLASSSYAATLPTDIDVVIASNAHIEVSTTNIYKMNRVTNATQQDDSDIKEIREEEPAIREARPLKLAKPL